MTSLDDPDKYWSSNYDLYISWFGWWFLSGSPRLPHGSR